MSKGGEHVIQPTFGLTGAISDFFLPDDYEDWGEAIQSTMGNAILAFAEGSWGLIRGAFEAGEMDEDWWATIIGGTITTTQDGSVISEFSHPGMLNVIVMVAIPILFIFVTFQVVASVFRASTVGMIRALATAVMAVPVTYIVAGLVFLIMQAIDAVTMWILDVGADGSSGQDIALTAILGMFGLAYAPDASDEQVGDVVLDENSAIWAMADGGMVGTVILPFIVAIILWLISMLLMLMMVFRTVAILVLTMFSPIAVFSVSFEAAKGIFTKWISVVAALMLSKPVAAAIIKMGTVMVAISDDWTRMISGMVLFLVAAAMPLFMLTFVTFMTGDSSRGMEAAAVGGGMMAASRTKRGASGAARRGMRMGSRAMRGGRR